MIITLMISWYDEKNPTRKNELQGVALKNFEGDDFHKEGYFNCIKVLMNREEYQSMDRGSFIKVVERRRCCNIHLIDSLKPTFADFFELCKDNEINVIANTDIYFDGFAISQIKSYFKNLKEFGNEHGVCLALSRWDVDKDGVPSHFDRADSQDCWIFYGKPNIIGDTNFSLGVAGTDNHIAHLIKESGYTVLNPSQTIRTYHYHNSGIRNYLNDEGKPKETIPPPYHLIHSTK